MPASVELSLEMPAAEAVRQTLLVQLDEIRNQAKLALEDDLKVSVTAVHDLRVAVRRSLAILEGFSPWLEAGWIHKAGKGYREILKPLGVLRDLDVLVEWASGLPADAAGLESVFCRQLERDRDAARSRLPDRLGGKDFLKWLSRSTSGLTLPDATIRMTPPAISAHGVVRLYRLQDCLPVVLYTAAANLTVYHAAIPDLTTLDEKTRQNEAFCREMGEVPIVVLHRLRVAAKNFRYLAEACQPVLGPQPARQLIQDFKRFQDLLGSWHDAVIAGQYIGLYLDQDHAAGGSTPYREDCQWRQNDTKAAFQQLWPAMTPAWFHTRLSACLD